MVSVCDSSPGEGVEEEGIVKCITNDSAFTLKAQVMEKAPLGKEIPPYRFQSQSMPSLP